MANAAMYVMLKWREQQKRAVAAEAALAAAQLEAAVEAPASPTVKRGPGRPRKQPTALESIHE